MKKIGILIVTLLLVNNSLAQSGAGRGPNNDCEPRMMDDRGQRGIHSEEMMAFRLSEKLELTAEQADKFFPRFREHRVAIEKIKNDAYEANKAIHEKIKSGTELSDAELKKAIKVKDDSKNKLELERDNFIKSIDGILDNNQIAKLVLAPKHFRGKKTKMFKHKPQNRW